VRDDGSTWPDQQDLCQQMPETVLIVDDDSTFRSLAAHISRAHGFADAGEAGGAAEGATAAQSLRPDAALVDIGLPDGSGIELAGELARLPWSWSPRVVLISNNRDFAGAKRPGASGTQLPFVAKEDLGKTRLTSCWAAPGSDRASPAAAVCPDPPARRGSASCRRRTATCAPSPARPARLPPSARGSRAAEAVRGGVDRGRQTIDLLDQTGQVGLLVLVEAAKRSDFGAETHERVEPEEAPFRRQ
jgi:two-component system nitrate/nitrite response regulator NarL